MFLKCDESLNTYISNYRINFLANEINLNHAREWRKGNSLQPGAPQMVHDTAPSPAVSGSRKKQKTSQPFASLAPALHPSMQPSSSALRRGGPPPGPKTKKPKTVSHLLLL